MSITARCKETAGSYSIEGALALTVFTACLMALLSILTMMKTEAEIGDALHETAMELSQYSYVLGRSEYLKEEAGEKLPALKELLGDEDGFSDLALTGPAVAKLLTKQNFPRDDVDGWLRKQGIENGFEGLDFLDTQVLLDGKSIVVAVQYDLNVQTFGFFQKTLHQRVAAATYGLLPTDAALKASRQKTAQTTIWQESNFVRGKYFANEIRSEAGYGAPVKTGQGIDLYDASTGTYVEVNSINLFLPTYADSGTPKTEAINKALFGFAKDFRKDLLTLGGEVAMADGTTAKAVSARRSILIVIVPEEVETDGAINGALNAAAQKVQQQYGMTVEVRYEQKALGQSGEENQT